MSESEGTLMGPPEKRASAMPDSLPEMRQPSRTSCAPGRRGAQSPQPHAPVGADSGLWHVPSDSKIGSCTWRNFHFRPPGLTPLVD